MPIQFVRPQDQPDLVFLDLGDLKLERQGKPVDPEYIALFQYFNVKTYEKAKSTESWGLIFSPPNKFFATLSEDDQKVLAMMYLTMHYIIADSLDETVDIVSKLPEVVDEIGRVLDEVDKQIHLCEKLQVFVEDQVPIASYKNAGSKPMHTEAMTFRRPEIIILTAVAVLCKMLVPIFGVLLDRLKNKVDNNHKGHFCLPILKPTLERQYLCVMLKINGFISNILKPYLKADITNSYSNCTPHSMSLMMLIRMLTRWFPNVNIYVEEGNIMTFITTSIRHATESDYHTAVKKNKITERRDPTDSGKDDSNASRLECESRRSNKTADIPTIIKVSIIRGIVEGAITSGTVSRDEFDAAIAYYRRNMVPITPINNYMLCTYFGHRIGGAQGIAMVSAGAYMQLIALLQLTLARMDMAELTHALSAVPALTAKAGASEIDNTIRMTWRTTFEYRNCRDMFPAGAGEKEWDAKLTEIVEMVTGRSLVYNTAPVIWDILGEEEHNNKIFEYTEKFPRDLCRFISYGV